MPIIICRPTPTVRKFSNIKLTAKKIIEIIDNGNNILLYTNELILQVSSEDLYDPFRLNKDARENVSSLLSETKNDTGKCKAF